MGFWGRFWFTHLVMHVSQKDWKQRSYAHATGFHMMFRQMGHKKCSMSTFEKWTIDLGIPPSWRSSSGFM